MLLVSLLSQSYTDKRMQLKFSKAVLLVFGLLIVSLVSVIVLRMQTKSQSTISNSITVPPITPIPSSSPIAIKYAFPIKNTVTRTQFKEFQGSAIGELLLNAEDRLNTNDFPKEYFTKFSDGEVTYLHLNEERIHTDSEVKERLVADKKERDNTVRIYEVYYNNPLLRVSSSSFEQVVNYEKEQLFVGGYDEKKNSDSIKEVIAFGHKGVELQRLMQDIYYWHTLIVPLNNYVYIFYARDITSPSTVNVAASSFQFVNYPD